MKILIIGSGAREHALAHHLGKHHNTHLEGTPDSSQIEKLADFAEEGNYDLTVVGPEAPLEAGIANLFAKRGLKLFGPTKEGALLESSKAFAKEFMQRHDIPTARYTIFTDLTEALKEVPTLIEEWGGVAVKPSGLTAGKGVICCTNEKEAEQALRIHLEEKRYGESCTTVIVEELLEGRECSVLTITDGNTISAFPLSQDHKRLLDNDLGPNTGGVGAYSPVPFMKSTIADEICSKTLEGLQQEGIPYCGFLYIGLMLTDEGPKVLEYNCRLGDPETQVVLPLLESDLATSMAAALKGELDKAPTLFSEKASCGVVLCSGGYPTTFSIGHPIEGLDAPEEEDLFIYHAGTKKNEDGIFVTSGGRVLTVVAVDDTLDNAIKRAYEKAETVSFKNCHYRKDIAHQVTG
jgi:phosphoribosylamine--glycine ligase